jgi:hypothetical protein
MSWRYHLSRKPCFHAFLFAGFGNGPVLRRWGFLFGDEYVGRCDFPFICRGVHRLRFRGSLGGMHDGRINRCFRSWKRRGMRRAGCFDPFSRGWMMLLLDLLVSIYLDRILSFNWFLHCCIRRSLWCDFLCWFLGNRFGFYGT